MVTRRRRAASAKGGGSPFGGFGGFGDISDIFDEFFGGGLGGRSNRQRGPARGNDLRYDLEITFQEAVFGAEKEARSAAPGNLHALWRERRRARHYAHPLPAVQRQRRDPAPDKQILGQFVNVTACPRCNGEGEIVTTPCTVCKGAEARARHVEAGRQYSGRRGRRYAYSVGRRGASRATAGGLRQPVCDAGTSSRTVCSNARRMTFCRTCR